MNSAGQPDAASDLIAKFDCETDTLISRDFALVHRE
jgi:hypothetical protein